VWPTSEICAIYHYHAAIAEGLAPQLILFQLQPALGVVLFDADVLRRRLDIPASSR
jgi:hypothetical protein